jgi:hypothetical protein
MEGNPFAGTPFEQDWLDGLNAGMVAPQASISAPSPLAPEAQDAFNQGVQTGQILNAALDPPIPTHSSLDTALHVVHGAFDATGPFVAAASKGKAKAIAAAAAQGVEATFAEIVAAVRAELTAMAFGGTVLEIAFSLGVFVAVWGPQRDDFFTIAVSARLESVRQQLEAAGSADQNLELFMAVCDEPEHELGTSDPLTDLGVWHGLFRLDFETAAADAAEHEHASSVRVHRYQTATPMFTDVLTVP